MRTSVFSRVLLLLMVLVCSYQVVAGINFFSSWSVLYFTLAFGVLIIAGLLLLIFGPSILSNPMVVVVAALVPLGMALGLIASSLPSFHIPYLIFSLVGLLLIALTRKSRWATLVLVFFHGLAGATLFFLPFFLWSKGSYAGVLFISLGAAIIGAGGMLLGAIQMGRPILPKKIIFTILPWILLFMSLAFSLGLKYL